VAGPGRERDRRREDAAWIAWLRRFDWDWFATPSFRYPVSPRHALDAVTAWLATVPGSYGVIGLQRGSWGDRCHVHGLFGGTGRRPIVRNLLHGAWRRGNLDLQAFHPGKGAIEYVVAQANEIELIGTPVPYRPRR